MSCTTQTHAPEFFAPDPTDDPQWIADRAEHYIEEERRWREERRSVLYGRLCDAVGKLAARPRSVSHPYSISTDYIVMVVRLWDSWARHNLS